MRQPDRRLLLHVGVLGLYLALAVVMTWPVAAHVNERLAGYSADNSQFVWTLWVFRQELLTGKSPLHTDRIYFPEGISLALHTLVPSKSVPAMGLLPFLSPIATFNVLILASLTLCGYGAWLLIRDLTGDDQAALVGGAAFAFSPILIAHASAGHLNFASAEGIPFFVLFFCRAVKERRHSHALWAGLAMAYAGLSDWTYLLFLIMFWLLHLAYYSAKSWRSHLRWPVLRQYGITALVAILASAPLLVPALQESRASSYDLTRYVGGSALYVSDLLGFLTPSADHALVGRLVSPVFERFTGGLFEGTVYLGLSVIALSAVGLRRAGRKQGAFWLVVALFFATLSLGPGLHVLGRYQFPSLSWLRMGSVADRLGVPMRPEWVRMLDEAPMIPLPGAALQLLPVFKWMRAPSRFAIMLMLALAVLAGYGTTRVRELLRGRRWLHVPAPAAATILLGAIVLLEFCIVPFPTTPASRHPFHDQLTAEPGDFAILELPIEPFALLPQYWQTSHGKRLVYGHISRVPEERFDYLGRVEQEVFEPTGYFELVDIRFLVLHEGRLEALEAREAADLLSALEANFERVWTVDGARAYCAYDGCLSQESP